MQIRPTFLFLAIALCAAASCPAGEDCPTKEADVSVSSSKKIPVILDTDIGDDIDDTWALIMLMKSPQFDVKLITTTYGLQEYRAKLIAKLLTVAKRTGIPIGLGAGKTNRDLKQASWVKDYKLTDYPGKIHQDGVAAAIDVLKKSTEPVTILAIGPLDTMAALATKRPDLAAKANFVGMQGSVFKGYDGGKVSPEWNIVANVEAAKKVFSTPWRTMTITPLDTCGLVRLTGRRFEALKASKDPGVQAILENYRIWSNKKGIDDLKESTILFDTVAIYLANPGPKPLFETKVLPLVVTNDGFTKVDDKGQNVHVAVSWTDLDGYCDFLVKKLLEK
jgi:inosine-uridine nucleoside N-ribohydrolase